MPKQTGEWRREIVETSALAMGGTDNSYSNHSALGFNALGILQSKNTIRSNIYSASLVEYPIRN